MGHPSRCYMMLTALVLATTMSVMLAMAMEPAITAGLRQKERTLIYRGEHIAMGIRRFYFKHRRFPVNLDELMDDNPRFIRKLYEDPITGSADWTLVYLGAGDVNAMQGLVRSTARALEGAGVAESGQLSGEQNSRNEAETGAAAQNRDSMFAVDTRQITGLRSSSDATGLKVFQDSRIYSDWLFSAIPPKKNELEQNVKSLTGGK